MSAQLTTTSNAVAHSSGYWEVLRLIGVFRRVMEPYFARFGISQAQWGVLRILHCAEASGEPLMKLADLGGRLLIRPSSVTNMVEKMRVAGLISREASPVDQRAKSVRLTEAGRQLVDRVLLCHAKQIDAVMSGLNPQEQALFRDLLHKLNTHLEGQAPADWPAEE
ncbi:MAG: MarR family transcriptional regulator [Tepidisphaeraceae bacterium]